MMVEVFSPDSARTIRVERAIRIRRLKRRIAMFMSQGIDPVLLVNIMVELMTLQEKHQESPNE
tara:strand:- start:639 stop:827 length:189 start_codon:yes stop_codon:yes gene_type:complete